MVVVDNMEFSVLVQDEDDPEKYHVASEYDNPESGHLGDNQTPTKYIQAKSGRKFRLQCTFLPGFTFYGADATEVRLRIDDNLIVGRYFTRSRYCTKDGIVQRQQSEVIRDEYISTGVNTVRVSFSFGSSNNDENADAGNEAGIKAGEIYAYCTRVTTAELKPCATFNTYHERSKLSKKSILSAVSHTLNVVEEKVMKDTFTQERAVCTPIDGEPGRKFGAIFRYRSLRSLALIGCTSSSANELVHSESDHGDGCSVRSKVSKGSDGSVLVDASTETKDESPQSIQNQAQEIMRLKAEKQWYADQLASSQALVASLEASRRLEQVGAGITGGPSPSHTPLL